MSVNVVVDLRNTLGESPCWDPKRKMFLWVDIMEKKIFRLHTLNDELEEVQLNQSAGCLSQTNRGWTILGLQHGIHFFDWDTGILESVVDPESHLEENRFNDGKCDPSGRFWAGTTDQTGVNGNGSLYVVHSTLQITKKVESVSTSNGLA